MVGTFLNFNLISIIAKQTNQHNISTEIYC